MRKLPLLIVLLIALGAATCSTNYGYNLLGRPTPTPSPAAVSIPVMAGWQISAHPVVSSGDFVFAVHALLLTGQQTTVLYSLSGPAAGAPLSASSIRMIDDVKQEYPLLRVTNLGQLDQLQVGVLAFSTRHAGIRELHVLVRPSAGATPLDLLAAQAPYEPDYRIDSTQTTSGSGCFDQGGYRVSFNGWALHKGDIVADAQSAQGMTMQEVLRQNVTEAASHPAPAGATPTIVPPNPSALQLSGGKPVGDEATLRIENLQSRQVRLLYIVFLMDGDVKATFVQ